MKTFRELLDQYLDTNPHYFKKTSIEYIRSSGRAFKVIENEPYVLVPKEVLDSIINSKTSDYVRTKCAFIVRTLDHIVAIEKCKDKIIHPNITQTKAIKFALTHNKAYKDENIRSIALENGGKQEGTLGYALLSLLIQKENIISEKSIEHLRYSASKFEKLYDNNLNNISDNDVREALSRCPDRIISCCNQLLKALNCLTDERRL